MDLRVKRTTKNIKDAFYELRKKKSIDKISVKELSELAMINKATFYLHYRDIYELSDKLENELIEKIIDDVKGVNFLEGREEFKYFFETISSSILCHADKIKTLFSGYENNHFINRLEDTLKEYIFSAFPTIQNNSTNNIIITFLIQGSYHTYFRNPSVKPEFLVDSATTLLLKLSETYTF
ncbi:MAG: TetR/AcrR family transcriptional regulator [Ruminococcus sp.]|nr:TetR/AcrR family transcriptional regulator [Ruminococcus sp.]